jgi:ABC-type polysaccharide transport system permease subunit
MFLPVAAYFLVFYYAPMVGVSIAFQKFNMRRGIFGSDWVGFDNFATLFSGDTFPLVMRNTSVIALLNLTVGFVVPIILAIVFSELRDSAKAYKRTVQTISYMPFFVAAVVTTSLVKEFLGASGGLTKILSFFGLEQQNWLANPKPPVFWIIMCATEIWQGMGYGAIVYVAAIASINGDLFEAAAIDGANRWKRLWRITLPSITPLIIMMLTLKAGTVLMTGFDKALLLYMPKTYDVSDVLYTYTYRMAFSAQADYGLSAASGLFQSAINTTLLLASNYISRKVAKTSLF